MGDLARIIVVDDEPDLRRLAASMLDMELTRIAHLITQAASGVEALVCCAREHIDVMVLDMNMPEVDGLTVLRHISVLDDRPCVVAWSADEIALHHAKRCGADIAVKKGGDALALVRAVADCLGRY
jgi:CheY-like chemotaxis protein